MNITTLLDMAAEAFPDRVAITSNVGQLTYSQFLEASRSGARLLGSLGSRHAVLLDVNGMAAPTALFAAAMAEIPYVPLNYRLADAELDALVARVTPAALIAGPENLARLNLPDGTTAIERDAWIATTRDSYPACTEPSGDEHVVAVQLFTSGTTGKPKAAILKHDNLMAYILGTVEFASADADEAGLITVPPYHIAGISAVLSSTYSGRRMVMLESFEPRLWLDTCQKERATYAFIVPTMLTRIVDEMQRAPGHWDLGALRAIAFGGGKMPVPVITRAMEVLPDVDFTNAYGLTETSSTICLLSPDNHREAMSSPDAHIRRRLGSVGRPIDTVEIEIRDDAGNVLPHEKAGHVFVRGGQIAGAYLGVGSLLEAGGWFPTRDRGYRDAEGFLFLDGRDDDVIVRGGENISPGEIEDILLAHPSVTDAAVVAVPDDAWGEAVGAAIVVREGTEVPADELRTWVRDRLRSSRVPAVIEFRSALPYNDLGKILRRVIRDELQNRAPTLDLDR
jgi:acyl-CoA synthetase (AMP-forming)/AMP-acid ligase II